MSEPPLSPTPDALSRLNRWVLSSLGVSFLVMSAGVFLDTGATGKTALFSPSGVEGKKVWNENNCMVCHQFFGMGGYLGPDLTNVIDRLGPETTAWVLRNGRGSMPDMNLSDADIAALVAFLSDMTTAGTFPQKSWPAQWFPTANKNGDDS
ncbi:MAG TPA: cytochrome c [Planctomycetota bacterium]|nr:cytochrome c [Planctomycetota bacterium]MDP7246701.1 cytochrome c [Planctomycetota bacterium]HJM38553.1 cytochrome c [Planctomycetota bacterium]